MKGIWVVIGDQSLLAIISAFRFRLGLEVEALLPGGVQGSPGTFDSALALHWEAQRHLQLWSPVGRSALVCVYFPQPISRFSTLSKKNPIDLRKLGEHG